MSAVELAPLPRRAPRRRASMVVLALLLSAVFVVNPAAQARAFLPVVFMAAGTLARAALPTVVARLAPLAFTTPLRGAIVTRLGITTAGGMTSWGRLGLNAAGLVGIGATGVGLGQWAIGENPLELGMSQDELDAMNGYARAQSGSGSMAAPATLAGTGCRLQLDSYQWGWNSAGGGSWELRAQFSGGAEGPVWSTSPYDAQDEAYRYSICSSAGGSGNPLTSADLRLVNIVTGVESTISATSARVVTDQVRYGDDWVSTVVLTPRAGQLGSNHVLHVDLKVAARSSPAWHPTSGVWGTLYNPFSPTGEDVGGGTATGEPYYGVRHCENSQSQTQNLVTTSTTGLPIPAECPSGWWSQGFTIYQGDPGAPGSVELYKIGKNPGWNLDENQANRYPGCANPDGSSTGICELGVTVDGRQCGYGVVGCAGWLELSTSAPDRVRCYWGPHIMVPEDCAPLRYAYATAYGVGVDQMIDLDSPNMVPGPGTQDPWPAPLPNVDPNQTPWPNPGSNPPPTTDPGGAGTLPLTGTSPVASSQLNEDPHDFGACMGGMWSWNPVDWVVLPVKCALQWAFVPREVAVRQMRSDMEARQAATTVNQYASSVGALVLPAFDSSGCLGPRVELELVWVDPYVGYPLSACEGAGAQLAGMSFVFTSLAFGVLAFVSISRSVAGVVGFTKIGGNDDD